MSEPNSVKQLTGGPQLEQGTVNGDNWSRERVKTSEAMAKIVDLTPRTMGIYRKVLSMENSAVLPIERTTLSITGREYQR